MKWSKGLSYRSVKQVGILAVAVAALAMTAHAQEVFSPPKNISNTAHAYPYEQFGIDTTGNLNVIWMDNSPGNYALFFARSTNGALTFSAALNVSNHPSGSVAGSPQIALDPSGNIDLVWQDNSAGHSAVFFSQSTDAGAHFSVPLMVSNASATGAGGQIAIDSTGNVDLAWQDNSPGYAAIFFGRSTDGGSNFSTPVNISNNPLGTNSVPSIHLDSSGNIYVVWVAASTYTSGGSSFNTQDVDISSSTDGGNSFSAPSVVSPGEPGTVRQSPQVAANSPGNINVVWAEMDSFSEIWSVAFASSNDGGASFSNMASDTTCMYPPAPQMVLDSAGGINTVWQAPCGDNSSDVEFARSAAGGTDFTVSTLADPTGYSPLPQLAIDSSDNINVVFYGSGISGDNGIFFARSTDGGNTFSAPQDLSNDGGTNPQIAMDSSGQIRIVWSAGNDIFFSGNLALTCLSVNPANVSGGGSSTGTVTLSEPAPSGGVVISLSSSDSAAAGVPASVTVLEGSENAMFNVSTSPLSTSTSVILSASYNGVTQTASLTVTSSILTSLTLSPSSVTGGSSAIGTVTLGAPAPSGGTVVSLSSSNMGVAAVPGNVTIAAGATYANFTVTTQAVSTPTSVTISASFGGSIQTVSLTVTPPTLIGLTLSPSSVIGGSSSTGKVTLSGPAPSGGEVVSLSSSNAGVATVPSSVMVAGGSMTASFTVTTIPVGTSTSITISAVLNGATRTASLTVLPPSLTLLTLNPSSVTAGGSSTGTVTLSGPAPSGGVVVSLSSSDNNEAAVQSSVTIPAGAPTATFKVNTNLLVLSQTDMTISALYGGVTRTTSLTVVPVTGTLGGTVGGILKGARGLL
jgi:hypothetical protein